MVLRLKRVRIWLVMKIKGIRVLRIKNKGCQEKALSAPRKKSIRKNGIIRQDQFRRLREREIKEET